MKVVINACFGGFSISHDAVMMYAKLKGITLYPYVSDSKDLYKMIPYLPSNKDAWCIHYFTKPVREDNLPHDDSYFSPRDIERNDPILIQVVEAMGEKANGGCASLKIIEIPDNVKWHVEDYDGMEHIAEDHQTWS